MLKRLTSILFHLGYFGPLLMGVLDSSFLFLPFGNDLLVVALTLRHHGGYLAYAVMAAIGSTLGVFLIDLVARRLGEAGIAKVAGQERFDRLKSKITKYGGKSIAVGCLAPPPFPFTMLVAANSALGYPRLRLLSIVASARLGRFLVLGMLALHFGRVIIRIANSAGFRGFMYVFTLLCLGGSIFSIVIWLRRGRSPKGPAAPSEQTS